MNELTVVIPFLNEGQEVETTIQEIKRTAGDAVDIILVNDASDDGFDYDAIAAKYHTEYIKHTQRQGSGPAKQAGINACRTPYFLVIDGHMRFYDNNWWIEIPKAIQSDPRAIYCCRCQSWDFDTKQEKTTKPPYGAYFQMLDSKNKKVLDVKWCKGAFNPEGDLKDIPCVLGACYAATKNYWNYLRGYDGLKLYSCEEAYISMKAWMEGGRCRILCHVTIGHLFRKRFPYKVIATEYYYNKLLIAELLLPKEQRDIVIRAMKAANYVEYVRSRRQMEENKAEIDSLREDYSRILTAGYNRFDNINNRALALYNNTTKTSSNKKTLSHEKNRTLSAVDPGSPDRSGAGATIH